MKSVNNVAFIYQCAMSKASKEWQPCSLIIALTWYAKVLVPFASTKRRRQLLLSSIF